MKIQINQDIRKSHYYHVVKLVLALRFQVFRFGVDLEKSQFDANRCVSIFELSDKVSQYEVMFIKEKNIIHVRKYL